MGMMSGMMMMMKMMTMMVVMMQFGWMIMMRRGLMVQHAAQMLNALFSDIAMAWRSYICWSGGG